MTDLPEPVPRREAIWAIAWLVLVGTAGGAVAGFLVGGIGGRLAMLLLRVTSDELVIGLTSDDGFEIGVVTADTFQLLLAMTMLGALNGILYVVLRDLIPDRLRLGLWTAFAALAGGATVVHEDGVDFTLLSPRLLSIALFVLLPGAAAALVVLLVERWAREPAWRDRRLASLVVVASLASTFALAAAALVVAGALLIRRTGARRWLLPLGRLVAPVGLAALAAYAGIDLAVEAARILD